MGLWNVREAGVKRLLPSYVPFPTDLQLCPLSAPLFCSPLVRKSACFIPPQEEERKRTEGLRSSRHPFCMWTATSFDMFSPILWLNCPPLPNPTLGTRWIFNIFFPSSFSFFFLTSPLRFLSSKQKSQHDRWDSFRRFSQCQLSGTNAQEIQSKTGSNVNCLIRWVSHSIRSWLNSLDGRKGSEIPFSIPVLLVKPLLFCWCFFTCYAAEKRCSDQGSGVSYFAVTNVHTGFSNLCLLRSKSHWYQQVQCS